MENNLPRMESNIPPRPSGSLYSIETLRLFPRITRRVFQEMFGVQAPPFDPTRRWVKYWWDTSVANMPDRAVYTFDYVDRSGALPVYSTMTISAAEAARPNMPGRYAYPSYTIAPTRAFVQRPDGQRTDFIPAEIGKAACGGRV